MTGDSTSSLGMSFSLSPDSWSLLPPLRESSYSSGSSPQSYSPKRLGNAVPPLKGVGELSKPSTEFSISKSGIFNDGRF